MLGQDDMDPSQLTAEEIALDPKSYSAKTVPQRMGIISAGVIMNVITGLIFFAIAFKFGVETAPATVGEVLISRPAWQRGLQTGDTVTRINDRTIETFSDILRGTTLSRGDIRLGGVHGDGKTFEVTIAPNSEGKRRLIGVAPAHSLNVMAYGKESKWTVLPGSPAAAFGDTFSDKSTISAVNGEPVKTYAELQNLFAQKRSETLTLTVQKDGAASDVELKPAKFREIGIWLDLEPVSAIQDGSPAANAGIRVGDRITSVNGEDVGQQINPLHLSDYIENLAGEEVVIGVERIVEGSPKPQDVTIKLIPDPTRPSWTELVNAQHHPDLPLAIPSIGVAYHLTSNILKVIEGSPAHAAKLPNTAAIKSMKLETSDPGFKEVMGKSTYEISFSPDTGKNMAYAYRLLQQMPDAKITLTLQGEKGGTFTVASVESTHEWYIPNRGILFAPASLNMKAADWASAFPLAFTHTRNTAVDIYLTLRNLISRDLSPQNLQGPIGIAKVAYAVADDIPRLMLFLGFLSINLAVLNFLPIPVLDCGHMVFLIWEGVTRRKPSERVLTAALYVGLTFIVLLMGFVLFLDLFIHTAG